MNLQILKQLKNGEACIIKEIKGPDLPQFPENEAFIPDSIIQRGPLANCETFTSRIHFKAQKQIFVTYVRNDGKIYSTTLQHLKQVNQTNLFPILIFQPFT